MQSISRIGERTLSTNAPAAIVLSHRSYYYALSDYRCSHAPVGRLTLEAKRRTAQSVTGATAFPLKDTMF